MPAKITFSQDQILELNNLITKGLKQSDIAKHFNVTDDTIRRICKENNIEIRMPHECICIICGDTFFSNVKGAKTCNKEHHKICSVCGQDFIVDRFNIRNTCSRECYSIEKYGVKHHLQNKAVVEKRIATLQDKYGVTNVSQLFDHNEKSKNTCLEKYGSESYASSEEGRRTIRKTNLEKYGYEEPLSDPKFRHNIDKINIEKYGTANPTQTKQIKDKTKQTVLTNYGVENVMQDNRVKEKWKQNYRNKHGYSHPMDDPESLAKLSQTCQDKFGVPWACMRKEARNFKVKSKINIQFEQTLIENGIEFETEFPLYSFSYDFKCRNTLIEIDPTITHNSAMSIFPKSEPKNNMYHLTKTKTAFNNGFKCIHIFDWDSWDKIVKLLMPKEKIYARKCDIKDIPEDEASRFINKYHIQGQCRGATTCLGLFYNNELVEVMTFGKPRYNKNYDIELLRLCAKDNIEVVGGPSKLFKYFVKQNSDKTIISYCDIAKFSGRVYEAIGMTLSHESTPNKIWSKGTQCITDNLLRQRGFDQLFNTNYGKGTSNEELMLKHGWLPVYDCGQKVFEWTNK